MAAADRGYVAPACPGHATEDELAELDAVRQRAEAHHEEFQRSLPVACDARPVIEADLEAARAAADDETKLRVLSAWQGGECAVCGQPNAHTLDHDHETGLVRGWLCQSCNWQEPGGADRFLRYRVTNPASMLGLQIRYVGPFAWPALPPVEPDRHGSYGLAARFGHSK
jgi:hypothetical protein